jgi:hypothetical protein
VAKQIIEMGLYNSFHDTGILFRTSGFMYWLVNALTDNSFVYTVRAGQWFKLELTFRLL